jgi:opacity protein-like surface antigen
MSMKWLFACAVAIGCIPGLARAQDRSASVGGGVSAFNLDSHTSVAYTASFDFRFTRVVGLEMEATFVPSLNAPYPGGAVITNSPIILPFPTITLTNEGGNATIWSNNVRVAIPTTAARLEPFFVAGGGVASVKHTADLSLSLPLIDIGPGLPALAPGARTLTQPLSSSSTGLALTLGGGLGIKATDHLWIDADLRLIRILGDQDQNVGRFGVGVRYRF